MASVIIHNKNGSLSSLSRENSLKTSKYDKSDSFLSLISNTKQAISSLVNDFSSSASTNDSSTSNSNNSSNEDDDNDEEDCFYDAVDACSETNTDIYSIINNLNKLDNQQSSDTDDDCKQFFFDTATSINTSETNFPVDLNDNENIKVSVDPVSEEEESDCEDAELETPWSFWIDRCERGTTKNEYEAGLKLIHTVETVQTFWSVCNNIPDISELPNRYSYHLMRHKRRPLWEDPENVKGGQWKFKCKKEDTSLVWREALLASIGEQFSDCVAPLDDIVGISVSRREKDDVIQIWNLDQTYQSKATICEKLQELVPGVKFSVKFYKAHNLHEAFEGKSNNSRNTSHNKSHNKYQNKSLSPESKSSMKNNNKKKYI